MPDIAAINGVAIADIASFSGVAKASLKVNGCDAPASGASLWCVVGADGGVATAAHSDLNDWTAYVSSNMGTTDYNAVGYGKDGSGSPLWVAVDSNGNREIRYSSDPTNTQGWSDTNVAAGKLYAVLWGNNVWMAAGQNGTLWRSTDGASWSAVDMSGATGWFTNGVDVRHLASDGAGTWMCDNHDQIFKSTDNGASWAKVYDTADSPLSDDGFKIRGIAYSTHSGTSRWVVFARDSGQTRIIHATAADTSSWTVATLDGGALQNQNLIAHSNRHIAAAGSTVIMVVADNVSRSTDGGQDWTYYTSDNDDLPRTDARGLATDGNGTWVVVHDSGRVSINTNDGAAGSWAEQTGVQDGGSNTNLRFPTGGNNVENLDAVAANVYLPL
tara:strand:- start:13 stop:1170 length:1158 start_codon:yes stop_codon:yes gene_type:complete